MDAKHKRGKLQRVALGMAEAMKPAYHTNKPLLREIAASAHHMVKPDSKPTVAWVEPLTMLYNPTIHRKPLPLAVRCMVACDGELVRKADYFRR
jgi:hypothetical protein